jgi:hypothetical protein
MSKGNNHPYQHDWYQYQVFLDEWNNNTLTPSNEVYKLVSAMVWQACWRYRCRDEELDLCQETLSALAKGQYRKDASLKGYIQTIIINYIKKWWRKNGEGRIIQLGEGVEIVTDNGAGLAQVERRIFEEQYIKQLLPKLSNLQNTIVEVILSTENTYLSERKIVEKINESYPEHEVTRYLISTELKRLRNSLKH